MKKVLLTLAVAAIAGSVFAQGTVNYVNNGSGYKFPIYGTEAGNASVSKVGNTTAGLPAGTQVYTGAMLSGSGYLAQLFGATGNNAVESSLTGATSINTFRTGSAAGFMATTTATLTGVAADAAAATVQLRVWDNTSGLYATWAQAEAAWNAGLIAAGKSSLLNVGPVGGGTLSPASLAGMQSFNIYTVTIPEPSTMALAGLGAAALLIFRRRK